MGQLGFGAMMHYLGGGSANSADKYYGRRIAAASIADDRLNLSFDDGTKIQVWDDGQSCCESRYITCDDDVSSLVGHVLTAITAREYKEAEGEYGDSHEQIFVEVTTDDGHIVMCNHNEHNGYYGGFGLTITEGDPS